MEGLVAQGLAVPLGYPAYLTPVESGTQSSPRPSRQVCALVDDQTRHDLAPTAAVDVRLLRVQRISQVAQQSPSEGHDAQGSFVAGEGEVVGIARVGHIVADRGGGERGVDTTKHEIGDGWARRRADGQGTLERADIGQQADRGRRQRTSADGAAGLQDELIACAWEEDWMSMLTTMGCPTCAEALSRMDRPLRNPVAAACRGTSSKPAARMVRWRPRSARSGTQISRVPPERLGSR